LAIAEMTFQGHPMSSKTTWLDTENTTSY